MSHRTMLWTIRLILMLAITTNRFAFSQDQPRTVMAYYENSASGDALQSFASYIDQLPTDTFAIDAKGKTSGTAPVAALVFARSKGMQTFATVSNFGASDFVPAIAHAIVNSPNIRAKAIRNMLATVRTYGYSGINVDFESVPREDRAAFTRFVHDVARSMRAAGYLTAVSVPAERKDDPNDSWTGAFDFKALSRDVDVLQLMTYDEHGPWGAPGPVAGLDWVEACAQFAASVVPSRKISLGIPAYGYDWNLTNKTGAQIHWNQIPALIASVSAAPKWDAASSSPYFSYTGTDGSNHVVWYEDLESIPPKSKLAVTYSLAGISAFALGFEDRKFWDAVSSGLGNGKH
jgi:spore germination protein